MINILVLCTGNSCRSQMAEGFLRKYLGNRAAVYSAGIEAHGLNDRAVEIMKDDGIDISKQTSNTILELKETTFDYVVTVCDNAKEKCPYFPASTSQLHHNFPDPDKVEGSEQKKLDAFKKSRDEINEYCRKLSEKILIEI
ncbi:MAG: arsenate reductase ArsC [Vicingaceae bacterium]